MAIVEYILPQQPSGHARGFVEYKNGNQQAIRTHARPTIVRSNAANVGRWLIAELSLYWEHPLTDADRIGWGAYGYNTPLTDAYGNPRYIKGYAHYMRSNRARMRQAIARVDAPPTTYGLPTYTLPTLSVSFSMSLIFATIDPADDWANQDGGYMLLWAGTARSSAVTRPTETYLPAGVIAGSSAGITADWQLPIPSNISLTPVSTWIRSSVTESDGRLSG